MNHTLIIVLVIAGALVATAAIYFIRQIMVNIRCSIHAITHDKVDK